jgi:RNA polymerase sigma factor (sigma-70 family)
MLEKQLREIRRKKLDKLSDEEKYNLYLNKDYDTLVKAHMLYLFKVAMQYANNNRQLAEEYLSIMFEGVMKGLIKFNPELSSSISSYICVTAKNTLIQHLRNLKMQKRSGIHIEYDPNQDTRYEEEDKTEEEVTNMLNNIFANLKDKDKELMNHVRKGKSYREIAEVYNCSHQNIAEKVKRIMNKITPIAKRYEKDK